VVVRRSYESALHEAIVRACERAGFRMRIAQQANQIYTNLALVAEDFAIGFVARSVMTAFQHNVAVLELSASSRIRPDLYATWELDDGAPIVE
jgi:DNA-binding transcriptional LysR family regulator